MTLDEFIVKIGFTTNPQGLRNVEKQVVGVAERSKAAFSGLMGMVGKLAAGYSIFQIGKYAVTSAAQLERLQAQFEVMLGSADAAARMISDIQKLAASTPLESMGITESVKTLIQFGVAGDKAVDTVRMLGDVAGGDQVRLSSLALAYGQVVAAGRLAGQDMLQFVNTGFNPLKIMVENAAKFGLKAGTTMGQLRDEMSKGKVSAEAVAQAFRIATSKGGMFFQNMGKQSKTLGGLWSTLVDNIQLSLVKAIEPLIPLMKEFVDWVGQLDWTPVVNGVRTLAMFLTDYVVPALQVLKSSIADLTYYLVPITIMLVGAFGPRLVAMLMASTNSMNFLKAATLAYKAVIQFLGIEAMRHAGRQITANTMIKLSWANMGVAARTAGVAMRTALMSLLTPMNLLMVGMLGVWALYEKAKKETASTISEEDKKMDMFWIQSYQDTKRVDPLEDLYAQRDAMEKRYRETGALDGGKLARIRKRIEDKEAQKRDYEMRYERVFGKKPEDSLLSGVSSGMAQLQSIANNTKKIFNTFNLDTQIQATVDDKGETPLSIASVRSIADTAIRSALNVRLLGVLEGV